MNHSANSSAANTTSGCNMTVAVGGTNVPRLLSEQDGTGHLTYCDITIFGIGGVS